MTDEHDLGLSRDLEALLSRRRALGLLASASAVVASGCDRLPFFSEAEAEVMAAAADGAVCVVHPHETAGPFPADGSNRAHGTLANVLAHGGIVKRDMRTSLGGEGDAGGVPLALTLTLVSVGQSCTPLAGHAVYLWHCDAEGRYSIYDLPERSYLRAVGVSDAEGKVAFLTIVPGCYMGRFPHMHFEIYPSLETATDYRNRILTSQLAMTDEVCRDAYRRDAAYKTSIEHYAGSPLDRDMIFADNTPRQLAAQTPSMERLADGNYRGSVTIGIKAEAA